MNTIKIDKEKCTQCGLCINDCVAQCIAADEDGFPAMKYSQRCISCQHCFCICPTGALSFSGKNPADSDKISDKNILSLIKSRRSIRQYKEEELSEDELQKIKNMLPYIPTGCNSHKLHFSIVEKRSVMEALKNKENKK